MFEVDKNAKKKLVATHISLSLIVAGLLAFILYAVTPAIVEFFSSPQKYLPLTEESALTFQITALGIMAYIVIGFIGYVVYLLLTSKTRAELIANYITKDLADSRLQLEELYENAPVPYFTINSEGLIIGCNKSALRFFGVEPKEIAGKNFFAFADKEDLELGDKLLNYFKSDIPINKQEFRMITKNSGMKWVSLSIFLTSNFSSGEKNGLVTTFDLTEQKKLDQAKTEFVSLASHQLRTPLATVKWFTEMLASGDLGELNEKQKDYIKRMMTVNSDMNDLVETLLNVSRIEIGTLKIEKQEVEIVPLIDGIVLELQSQVSKKQIEIKKNFASSSKISSDPKLLRIIVQNLITNAIKYNKDGGTITIDFDGKNISVTDTGLGIPKADQDRVFSKLFRASNVGNVSSGQSTGLGLYLVKSIIESLGGSISFVSEENVGSTFTLTI